MHVLSLGLQCADKDAHKMQKGLAGKPLTDFLFALYKLNSALSETEVG
jgi:hypothetical protein